MTHKISVKFVRVTSGRELELGERRLGVYTLVQSGLVYIGQGHVMERVSRRRELEAVLEDAPAFVTTVTLKRDAVLLEWLLLTRAYEHGTQLSLKNRRGPERKKVWDSLDELGGEVRVEIVNRDPLTGDRIARPMDYHLELADDRILLHE